MDAVRRISEEQRELWNGSSGQAWVDVQTVTDVMFAPLARRQAQEARRGERGLDVGDRVDAELIGVDVDRGFIDFAV
jgi:hypothetical protein